MYQVLDVSFQELFKFHFTSSLRGLRTVEVNDNFMRTRKDTSEVFGIIFQIEFSLLGACAMPSFVRECHFHFKRFSQ